MIGMKPNSASLTLNTKKHPVKVIFHHGASKKIFVISVLNSLKTREKLRNYKVTQYSTQNWKMLKCFSIQCSPQFLRVDLVHEQKLDFKFNPASRKLTVYSFVSSKLRMFYIDTKTAEFDYVEEYIDCKPYFMANPFNKFEESQGQRFQILKYKE